MDRIGDVRLIGDRDREIEEIEEIGLCTSRFFVVVAPETTLNSLNTFENWCGE